MTWQLGAFAILFIALTAGFGWYERSRPDARIVALVATLAAFAALGRIAFAALPNVKPTTDIVLISGYTLGSAPGFVVGALAGLTSNFFFGQGPWTPWQMAAWGAAGLVGAGLGTVTRRRLRRVPLAMICALVGFAFTAVQDVGDWVTYSDHSLEALGVYVGKGLGFDAIHAGGCLVFALAFGPMLVRSIARFAARLQIRWLGAGELTLPLLLVGLLLGGGLAARLPTRVAAARAASAPASTTTYLLAAQNSDGGFGSAPGQASSQLFSGWAALGLAAAGEQPQDIRRGGQSLIAYLERGVGTLSDPGSLERTILDAGAAGLNPASFGGHDLVRGLERQIGGDGSVSEQTNLTAFAVLALRAARMTPRARTLSWLVRQEDQDGGFNYGTAGAVSDVDDTSAALEALAGAPGAAAARARARAIDFIRSQQDPDGGFPAGAGEGSNAQSTAWAVQGLIAARVDPAALRRAGPASPLQYLRSLIAPDGHVRYSRSNDQTPTWVTAEAMLALAAKPLPLASAGSARHKAGRAFHRRRGGTRPSATRARTRLRSGHPAVSAPRSAGAPSLTLQLASDAGIIDALALAPIGVG